MALLGSVERRLAASRNDDRGFSLTEVVIALSIATGVFLALGGAVITALKGTVTARQNQQSADVLTQTIESARSLSYSALSMVTSDLAGDSAITSGKFDPGTGTPEAIVSGAVGSISPHVSTLTLNSTTYTIKRYVTVPAGAGTASFRRLTAVATWSVKGQTHTRRASSYFVDTRRGLPLPRFTFTATGTTTKSVGAGLLVSWGFRIQNLGARDGWNFTGPTGSTWTYYVDVDCDGIHDDVETTLLADSDLDTLNRRDTGLLETGTVYCVLAEAIAPTTQGTYNQPFTVQSLAQPSAPSASSTITDVLTVTSNVSAAPTASPSASASASASASPTASPTASSPSLVVIGGVASTPVATCSGCSFLTYYLHQSPSGTTKNDASSHATFDKSTSTQTTAADYSQGKPGNGYGRYLATGGSLTSSMTDYDHMLDLRYQTANKDGFKVGTAVATFWVSCGPGATTSSQLLVGLGSNASATGWTQASSATVSVPTCDSAYRAVTVSLPITTAVSMKNNEYLVMRLAVPSTAASAVRVMYDYASTRSQIVLPS